MENNKGVQKDVIGFFEPYSKPLEDLAKKVKDDYVKEQEVLAIVIDKLKYSEPKNPLTISKLIIQALEKRFNFPINESTEPSTNESTEPSIENEPSIEMLLIQALKEKLGMKDSTSINNSNSINNDISKNNTSLDKIKLDKIKQFLKDAHVEQKAENLILSLANEVADVESLIQILASLQVKIKENSLSLSNVLKVAKENGQSLIDFITTKDKMDDANTGSFKSNESDLDNNGSNDNNGSKDENNRFETKNLLQGQSGVVTTLQTQKGVATSTYSFSGKKESTTAYVPES